MRNARDGSTRMRRSARENDPANFKTAPCGTCERLASKIEH
jgi:hypothetical protein